MTERPAAPLPEPPPPPEGPAWRTMWTTEHPRPPWLREWPGAWRLALATVCFGAFMGQLDASIVTLTFRPVEAEFHASLAAVSWVSLIYLLVVVGLVVPVGRISDARGRKLAYTYGFVVFSAGSAAAGLAPDLPLLLAARALQAVGAALLQANSVAIVVTVAPPGRSRQALGVQAAAQAVGLALGPTLGGVLVTTVGWRWVYAINVPVGVASIAAATWLLPRTRQFAERRPVDWPGVGLLAGATSLLLFAGSAVSGLALPDWQVGLVVAGALGAGVGFAARQRRARAPLLDARLFGGRVLHAGLAGGLLGYLALFGPLVLVPTLLGGSSARAGLVLTALPAGFALAATTAGRWLPAGWSDARRAGAGSAVAAAALAAAAVFGVGYRGEDIPGLVLCLAVVGLGLGVYAPANNAAVVGHVPPTSSGTIGGLVNMVRGLGTAFGVSIVALCLHVGPAGRGAGRLAFGALAAAAVGAVVASAVAGRD